MREHFTNSKGSHCGHHPHQRPAAGEELKAAHVPGDGAHDYSEEYCKDQLEEK